MTRILPRRRRRVRGVTPKEDELSAQVQALDALQSAARGRLAALLLNDRRELSTSTRELTAVAGLIVNNWPLFVEWAAPLASGVNLAEVEAACATETLPEGDAQEESDRRFAAKVAELVNIANQYAGAHPTGRGFANDIALAIERGDLNLDAGR